MKSRCIDEAGGEGQRGEGGAMIRRQRLSKPDLPVVSLQAADKPPLPSPKPRPTPPRRSAPSITPKPAALLTKPVSPASPSSREAGGDVSSGTAPHKSAPLASKARSMGRATRPISPIEEMLDPQLDEQLEQEGLQYFLRTFRSLEPVWACAEEDEKA